MLRVVLRTTRVKQELCDFTQ